MMQKLPFENGVINLEDYEIIEEPAPENETPRQFLLRMTEKDFPDLSSNGRDYSWQELEEVGALPLITRIIAIAYRPRILLRKKPDRDE